jgi:elongator complex protein 1
VLVLAHIRNLVDGGRWRRAYDACKRMRVDFNLLVDYRPELFLESVGEVVSQLGPENLQKVVMMMQDIDFTTTKYPDPKYPPTGPASAFFETKTNTVCAALRHAMLESDGPFLHAVLSTFAKQNPPDLRAALELVKGEAGGKLAGALAQDCFK